MARLLCGINGIQKGQGIPSTCQRKGKVERHYRIEGVNEEGSGEEERSIEKMSAQVPVSLDRETTLYACHNAGLQCHDQHSGHKDEALCGSS